MKTVVLGECPAELVGLLARRRALGQDRFDEVWEGAYHMAPASHPWHGYIDNELAELLGPLARAAGLVGTGPFNLGEPDDYRVPDRGYHRTLPATVWVPTAALVIEVVSPDDESWEKFDFYARRSVGEIGVADPQQRLVRWFARSGARYEEVEASSLLGIATADVIGAIDWPG